MASVTLAESAKLCRDELIAGVIENVITVNRMYEMLPFDGIDGNALGYNRENALGDVVTAGVGDTYTGLGSGKNPATFTYITSGLTTIMGDAEVNGMIQATRSDDGNDQAAVQIASKAKATGRQFQNMLVNGTGLSNQFTGMLSLVVAGQKVNTGTNGKALDFDTMDQLMDLVLDKDGAVDYFMMPARTIRSYKALLRALGGANVNETVAMPSGAEVPSYCSVPVFRNDYIPINQTKGSGSAQTTIFAGTFDDGSRTHGLVGLTAQNAAGIQVVDVGEAQDKDEHIYRVKWYCGLAMFSEKGIASADGITN
jgi:hypothetical protein